MKLAIADGHGSQVIPDWNYMFQAEVVCAVETAHGRNAMVRAHCPDERHPDVREGGVDIIDHADLIDDEGIGAVVAAGASVTPSYLWVGMAFAELDYFGPFPIGNGYETQEATLARLAGVKAQFEYSVSMLPKMRAGDQPLPRGRLRIRHDAPRRLRVGDGGLREVRHAADRGHAVGHAKRGSRDGPPRYGIGEIKEGKLADLIVVDGDPTDDVLVFRDPGNVQLVLKDGQVEKDLLSAACRGTGAGGRLSDDRFVRQRSPPRGGAA